MAGDGGVDPHVGMGAPCQSEPRQHTYRPRSPVPLARIEIRVRLDCVTAAAASQTEREFG
jgi:hypothetical protein